MSKKKRAHGRCHYKFHPGDLTYAQIREKKCGEKGCRYFEEFEQLSKRYQNNVKQKHNKEVAKIGKH